MGRPLLRLPSLVGDNMVLQQKAAVRIWGWYEAPDSLVTLSCDWMGDALTVMSSGGCWEFTVQVPSADHILHTVTVTAAGSVVSVKNILFGEVWFAGGQSNMEMRMKGYWRAPVEGSNREIAECRGYSEIRCFTAERQVSLTPSGDVPGRWEAASSDVLPMWSAVAWFYAKHLYRALGIPVGMIVSSWGGTKIEAWMAEEDLRRFSDVSCSALEHFDGTPATAAMDAPFIMYNGMLKPLTRYTVRGIIFYQGCSNVGTHTTYAAKMQALAIRWREDFGLGDIPFYFVEITPYIYDPREKGKGVWGALLREAQCGSQQLIPNSLMVCTNDLVDAWEASSIHPSRKEPIGERLAWCALNRDYGFSSVCCTYPTFKSARFRSGSVEVSFVNSPGTPASWEEFTNATGGGSDSPTLAIKFA